jgi:hypothetical protein
MDLKLLQERFRMTGEQICNTSVQPRRNNYCESRFYANALAVSVHCPNHIYRNFSKLKY